MNRRVPLLLALALAAPTAVATLGAQEKPLTKQEERESFHPRATPMDAELRLEAHRKRLDMEKASPLAALRFRNVGPEIQGGRVVDVEGVASKPDALLVAFATGGLWRTDNRGGSWTPLFDQEAAFAIGDVAVADADGQVVWIGTGENNSSRTTYDGAGVYKTSDGGRSWAHAGLTGTRRIGRVLIDPRDPDVVYVAALGALYTEHRERGVYKTTDGGKTWERVLFVDERTGAVDLVQDPSRPDVLYAAMWERARTPGNFLESGPGSGIWKTTDAGRTWTRLSGGFPQGATVGRIGLALAASRPGTVYAVLDNQALRPDSEPIDEEAPPGELTPLRLRKLDAEKFTRLTDDVVQRFLDRSGFPKELKAKQLKKDVKDGKTTLADLLAFMKDANRDLFENRVVQAEVYRTDDGGASWKRTHEGRIDSVFYSYGYYFARISVDPKDAERVYFGGVPLVGSTDGGKTWKGLDRRDVHVDHHVLWIDPRSTNRVVLGNDGGLNVSYDHGESWTKVNNLPVGQFTTIAVDEAEPYNIVGGLQDNGVLRGPSTYKAGRDEPDTWKEILGGDGSAVVIDPKDNNVVYTAYQFGFGFRVNVKTGERRPMRPRPEFSAEKKEKPLRYNWVTPFILSPHSNQIVYFGANRLYRSLDQGETWAAISDDLTSDREQGDVPFGTITQVAESPKKFGVLWVGTDEGKVWGSRDGGVTWTDLSAGLAKDRWVTRIVASVVDEGTVYVTQSGYRNDDFTPYVWRSADYGKTWESLATGLPAEAVNVIREDPKAKHLLYLGTDHGVFASLDRGKSWLPLTSGLPRVPVHDLAVQPKLGDLVLGTHARSVYVAEAAPLRKLTADTMGKALAVFPIKQMQGDRRRGYGEHPYLTWFRDDPKVPIAYWLESGAPSTITVKDEYGSVWKRFDGTAATGLNVVDYDLSADPKLADAAEAVARKKALERIKQKEAEQAKAAGAKGAKAGEKGGVAAPEEEAEADEAKAAERPLDEDLLAILADPLRETRSRFLLPGRYTVEVTSGGVTETTTLVIKAPTGGRGRRGEP
jgi:photosystem II stability/assembly factor-like uncharacterized protein